MDRRNKLCNSDLFQKQSPQIYFIFMTYFMVALCFPSLICYQHLPGSFFSQISEGDTDMSERENIAKWIGCVNVGTFIVAVSLGTFLTACLHKTKEQVPYSMSIHIGVTLIQLVCCAAVLLITCTSTPYDHEEVSSCISLAAMVVLAFTHGFTATHYLTGRPLMNEVPYKEQAEAYVQRSCIKNLAICCGLAIQVALITHM